jgi:hypothetical protein
MMVTHDIVTKPLASATKPFCASDAKALKLSPDSFHDIAAKRPG